MNDHWLCELLHLMGLQGYSFMASPTGASRLTAFGPLLRVVVTTTVKLTSAMNMESILERMCCKVRAVAAQRCNHSPFRPSLTTRGTVKSLYRAELGAQTRFHVVERLCFSAQPMFYMMENCKDTTVSMSRYRANRQYPGSLARHGGICPHIKSA